MKKLLLVLMAALMLLSIFAACGGGSDADTEGSGKLKILDTEYVSEEYAIAVNKDNTQLLDKLNSALKELQDDGTIQSILDKYIKA